MIRNVKLKGLGLENVSIKQNWLEGVLWKTPFWFTIFLWILYFSHGISLCLKIYHVRLYILKKMGFGMVPKWYEIHSKSKPLLQKTYIFYVSKTLVAYAGVFLFMHALAHVHRMLPMYVGRGPLWSFNFEK